MPFCQCQSLPFPSVTSYTVGYIHLQTKSMWALRIYHIYCIYIRWTLWLDYLQILNAFSKVFKSLSWLLKKLIRVRMESKQWDDQIKLYSQFDAEIHAKSYTVVTVHVSHIKALEKYVLHWFIHKHALINRWKCYIMNNTQRCKYQSH